MSNTRSIRIDLATPIEKQIRDCIDNIEKMPADIRLTNAQVKLGEALKELSSYVDEQLIKTLDSQNEGLRNAYKNYVGVLKIRIPGNLSGENMRLFKEWEDKIDKIANQSNP